MLIYKAIIDSYIRHKEFISANNVLRINNYMKIEIKNPENAVKYNKKHVYKNNGNVLCELKKNYGKKILVLEKLNKISRFFKNQQANRLKFH